jgi:hypothetical protein
MYKSYANLMQLTDPGYLGQMTTYQTTLLRMLESASEQIDKITHRHFNTWEGIQYFDGVARVLIPDEDILSISAITLDDGNQTYATTMLTTDYLAYPISGPQLYPKYMLKLTNNSSQGSFASAVLAGVKITGIFGYGNGLSATPYYDSGDTVQNNPMTISQTTITVTNPGGNTFSAGMTLKVDSEQMYVSEALGAVLGIVRAVNGTVATTHSRLTPIYIYTYPSPITEETLLLATAWWKQRENPTTYMAGNSLTGTYSITKDAEEIIAARLKNFIKRKLM